jgi:hypothetical protein
MYIPAEISAKSMYRYWENDYDRRITVAIFPERRRLKHK